MSTTVVSAVAAESTKWNPDNSTSKFKRIAVFCGSSIGNSPTFVEVFSRLGKDAVLGVMPKGMETREVSGDLIGDVRIVDDMHQRKAMMTAEADGFICLPGGYGTLEEGIEMLTWLQLGFHKKPVAFLNIDNFYDHLLAFFDNCVTQGFVRDSSRAMLLSATTPSSIIDQMEAYQSGPSVLDLAREGKLPVGQRG